MEIKREILNDLQQWKERKNRKPLLLKGARQIGKTWIMREFGKRNFEFIAEFNFDKTTELSDIFRKTKDTARIINELSLFTDVPIVAGKTLIIFDEIQSCEGALNSLKYFYEDAPEYHIIGAGSLLGVAVRNKQMSVPVGKVEVKTMFPVTFKEFLQSADNKTYQYINMLDAITALPEIIRNKLEEQYRRYLICGGMPEAIVSLLNNEGMQVIEDKLQHIIDLYTLDFSKYTSATEIPRIRNLWNSLPSQLAKENRKFIYRVVKTGARAREYEDALLWLEEAGLIHRVYNVSKPGVPLSAYRELTAFKVYASDCGLLRRMAKLSPEVILSDTAGFIEFKGALTENFILQSLVAVSEVEPYYWSSENRAEIDFLIQHGAIVIPAEVKSEHRVSGKSLSVYASKFNPVVIIRYSLNELAMNGNTLNIPLYLCDWTFDVLKMAKILSHN